MHVTYDPNPCKTELMQGDVLIRTSAIDELLREVHPHFHQRSKNLYFMVLTQSCDLVRRSGGYCKAPYITLAPVRALDLVVARHLAQAQANVSADLPVLGVKAKTKASEFLKRLLDNNEPGFFFLDAEDTSLDTDCVAFLNLSIAIKSDLHLQACLEAKTIQLDPTFQAKLGWLVGQMYSRVGTLDWDPNLLTKKVSEILKGAAIWVDDGKVAPLENAFKAVAAEKPDARMTQTEIQNVIKSVPTRKQQALAEAVRVIQDVLGPNQIDLAEKLRKRLDADAGFSTILK